MRVVLDTNVFISAVIFHGKVSRLVDLWKTKKFTLLLSADILKEYLRVLSYPKFKLNGDEVRYILKDELLPFVETVRVTVKAPGILKDKDDEKFLQCAEQGQAEYLVSGDGELLALDMYKGISIVNAGKFMTQILKS